MLLDVSIHQRFEQRAVPGRQRPLLFQKLAQRPLFIKHPGVHRRDQRVTRDQVHL